MKTIAENIAGSVNEAHKQWGWYLALGIVLVACGAYALYAVTAATIASIIVLGAILCIAGVFQLAAAVFARGAGHVILALLIGALDLIVGVMLLQHPGAGALTVTLLLAAFQAFGIASAMQNISGLVAEPGAWFLLSATASMVDGGIRLGPRQQSPAGRSP